MDAQTGQCCGKRTGFCPCRGLDSKLMTIELFPRLKDGRVKLSDTFPVPSALEHAGSNSCRAGPRIPVEDLIRGIIIQSAMTLAWWCGALAARRGLCRPDEQARQAVGLKPVHLRQSRCLPDPPGQLMSALDLAKLSRHLINDIRTYHYFSEREFVWHNIHSPTATCWGSLPPTGSRPATPMRPYGITILGQAGQSALILVLNGLRYPSITMTISPTSNVPRKPPGDDMAFREFRSYPVLATNQVIAISWLTVATCGCAGDRGASLNVTMASGSHSA